MTIPSNLHEFVRSRADALYFEIDPSGKWRVGDEVKCIRSNCATKPYQLPMEPLQVGKKYTIRAFNVLDRGVLGFYLSDVYNTAYLFADDVVRELSYDQGCFKRVSQSLAA
jgi:hypothetical protein